jgi:uncharacterized protein YndB with AHSA1/START domain
MSEQPQLPPTPHDAPVAPRDTPEKDTLPFLLRWPLLIGALAGAVLRLVFSGRPGHAFAAMEASFIYLAPVLVGAVTVYAAETRHRRTWAYYFRAGFLANALFVLGTMLILIEGIICAILIIPLFGFFGGISGLVMGAICRATNWPRQTIYGLAVLPLALGGLEPYLPLPERVNTVERVRVVAASPEKIWRQLENARDIAPQEVDHAWMYRIGVPLPKAGLTEWTPEGPVRKVTMGSGIHFDQIATEWQPNRHVRWTYRFAEDSFPPNALDDHVRIGGDYFDLRDTEYTLTPVGDATELRVRMRYRVSTQFNWYAAPLAEFLMGNFEDVILAFYARRAEADKAETR